MSSRVRAAVAPSHVAVGLLIALCALLLLKWLAVVALIALGLAGLLWWARRDPTAPSPTATPSPTHSPTPTPAPVAPRAPLDDSLHGGSLHGGSPDGSRDDCSWCGLRGGHRDAAGHLVRPRHVHGV